MSDTAASAVCQAALQVPCRVARDAVCNELRNGVLRTVVLRHGGGQLMHRHLRDAVRQNAGFSDQCSAECFPPSATSPLDSCPQLDSEAVLDVPQFQHILGRRVFGF